MTADDSRDLAMERLLRRALEIGSNAEVTPECLDAETLAAWADGGLDARAMKMVEAHAAGCLRCREMAAVIMQTAPAPAAAVPWWRRSLRSTWLVPLTAGAAAVLIWAVVPSRPPATTTTTAPPSGQSGPASQVAAAPESKASAQPSPALADRLEARADDAKETANKKRQMSNQERRADLAAEKDSQPAAPPPAAAEAPARSRGDAAGALMKQEAAVTREAASPDPQIRWRVGARGLIERTGDGGATWARVNFPESIDLVRVEAPDALTAIVTAADGRRFRTINGGQTWIQEPLQDFQAATF